MKGGRRALEDRGLKINRKKMEYTSFVDDGEGEVRMQGNDLKRANSFGLRERRFGCRNRAEFTQDERV